MKSCVGNRTMSNLLPSNLDPGAAHIVIGPSLLSLSINKRSKERDGEAAKMAMAYVAAAVLAAVTLTASFAGGEACNFVASMTWTAACQQTGRWENLCQQTLQTAPATAEVTVYALVATRLAKLRYENTLGEVDTMLWPRNAPPTRGRRWTTASTSTAWRWAGWTPSPTRYSPATSRTPGRSTSTPRSPSAPARMGCCGCRTSTIAGRCSPRSLRIMI